MIDLIKKAMLTGIGVASLTKEKIEEVANEFVEKGKLPEQEGKKFVQEMLQKSDESKEDLKKQFDQMLESALGKMQLVRAADLEELKKEIVILQKEVKELQKTE